MTVTANEWALKEILERMHRLNAADQDFIHQIEKRVNSITKAQSKYLFGLHAKVTDIVRSK